VLSSAGVVYLGDNPLSEEACACITELQAAGATVFLGEPCGGTAGQPRARVSAVPSSGEPPLEVQFTDHSWAPEVDPIVSWAWNFGDGESSAEQNPLHTYAAEGDYWANLAVTTASGVSSNLWGMWIYVMTPAK